MSSQVADRTRMDTPANVSVTRSEDGVSAGIAAPLDRVRWAAVLAGLFTVLATLAALTVLGIAIGLSTFDANASENFGIGAGIYGGISAIIAFLFGGFIAARTGAVAGSGNGLLNGAMVWIVTVVLIVNFLGTGIGTLLGTAGSVATTAANVASDAAAVAATNPELAQGAQNALATPAAGAAGTPGVADPAAAVAPIVEDVQNQLAQVTPADVEQAARDASNAAWGALLVLGLTALAAIGGGLLGTRSFPTDVATFKRA
ncbi:MAG: hypothetical protein SF123_05580 [Chloroflexota bacterium]|nr:hypothetical protein [Chloroflexota bacterium]